MAGKHLGSCSRLLSATGRSAVALLDSGSADLIGDFVLAQQNRDGGFRGRSPASDLYYTLFALESLQALGRTTSMAEVDGFLRPFNDGDGLDLVHLTCLVRCLARLPASLEQRERSRAVVRRLDQLRAPDGGYRLSLDAETGSIYACFLAVLAHEQSGFDLPDRQGLLRCIDDRRSADGAWADTPGLSAGTTTVTAAAVVLQRLLGEPIESEVGQWLLGRRGRHGGFSASPSAPVPDLLSTATALLGLQAARLPLPEPSLTAGFVEALWIDSGGFTGHPFDEVADCEYTYYGLLSLGAIGSCL